MLAMTAMVALCSEDTYSTRHERKPRLYDSIVKLLRYRQLVGIPPGGHEPPDVGLIRIR